MDWSECLDTNISYLGTVNDKMEVITDNGTYVIQINDDYKYDIHLPNGSIKKLDSYDIPYEINGEVSQIIVYNNGQVKVFQENDDGDGWFRPIIQDNNLGTEDYTNPYPLPECSICLKDIQQETGKRSDSCKHFFHKECIDTWLNTSKTCPECRTPFNKYSTFFGKKRTLLSDLKYLKNL
jgi:hypothetical protein